MSPVESRAKYELAAEAFSAQGPKHLFRFDGREALFDEVAPENVVKLQELVTRAHDNYHEVVLEFLIPNTEADGDKPAVFDTPAIEQVINWAEATYNKYDPLVSVDHWTGEKGEWWRVSIGRRKKRQPRYKSERGRSIFKGTRPDSSQD